MDLSGKTVAVTGATGFLGRHIVEELLRRGVIVRAVVRSPRKADALRALGVTIAEADLTNAQALAAAFAGADAVVANAALSTRLDRNWDDFVAANTQGAENVVRAAAEAGVMRIVNVSTAAVYASRLFRVNGADTPLMDATGSGPGLTWNRLTTNWRYTWSKARGESAARRLSEELGVGMTVVRPGPIYGPHDRKLTPRYASLMRRRVVLAPTAKIPHVHAGDVAIAIAGGLVNDASIGRAYAVTGLAVSPYDVLSTWRRLAGDGPWLIPVPVPAWMAFDDSEAERDLGYRSRSLEEGLRDVLKHPDLGYEEG